MVMIHLLVMRDVDILVVMKLDETNHQLLSISTVGCCSLDFVLNAFYS